MKRIKNLEDVPHYYKNMYDPHMEKIREFAIVDAIKPLKYWVSKDHLWGSSSKQKLKAFLNSSSRLKHCVQENALGCLPGVYLAFVQRSVAYVVFVSDINVAYKYDLPKDGKEIAEINDVDGKRGLLVRLKSGPVELVLLVPRYNHSLEYTQSPEHSARRATSRERRKINDANGKAPGNYTSPTKAGFRCSNAKVWDARHV